MQFSSPGSPGTRFLILNNYFYCRITVRTWQTVMWCRARPKCPFITDNSTRCRVELRRRSVYSDTTQLNSTDLLSADWLYAATGLVALPIAGDSWVASVKVSIATQLNSTELNSASSCVAINGSLAIGKGKGTWIYIARFLWYLTLKALRHGSHSVTCNYTNACVYLVSVHQMAPPQTEVAYI